MHPACKCNSHSNSRRRIHSNSCLTLQHTLSTTCLPGLMSLQLPSPQRHLVHSQSCHTLQCNSMAWRARHPLPLRQQVQPGCDRLMTWHFQGWSPAQQQQQHLGQGRQHTHRQTAWYCRSHPHPRKRRQDPRRKAFLTALVQRLPTMACPARLRNPASSTSLTGISSRGLHPRHQPPPSHLRQQQPRVGHKVQGLHPRRPTGQS